LIDSASLKVVRFAAIIIMGVGLLGWGGYGLWQTLSGPFPQTDFITWITEEGFVPASVPVNIDPVGGNTVADLQAQPIEIPTLIANDVVAEALETGELPADDLVEEEKQDGPVLPQEPTRIVINSINLDAPVIPAMLRQTWVMAKAYDQWMAPNEFAVGWHTHSAFLGNVGNTVLNGHHNVHGEVFRYLVDVHPGDIIQVYGSTHVFFYQSINKMILPERGVKAEQRFENARWISPSQDERLTLVTCYPYESNSHRLIIVAVPVGTRELRDDSSVIEK